MSSRKVDASGLGDALKRELTLYASDVTESVNVAAKKAAVKLVRITKSTAPQGVRGTYRRKIAYKEMPAKNGGKRYVWHVKAPDHRLTHLLVHGHATKDGGRTKADPFLRNALEDVLPEFEKEVKEAIKK